MRRAIVCLFASSLGLQAAQFSLGLGFRYVDPVGSVRLLKEVDTAQWTAPDLESLLVQLLDGEREEKDGERACREAGARLVAEALASGDHRPADGKGIGLVGRLAKHPGRRGFTALAWDGSTRPPSLVGCNTHEGIIVRQHLDGAQTLLAHLDPGTGAWVRARADHPLAASRIPVGFAPVDAPRGLVVDPSGAIDFTTDLNRLYRIGREGEPKLLAEWPLPDHARPYLGWMTGTCDLALGPGGARLLADHFGGQILRAAPGPQGAWAVEPVAGNGGGYGWREEAADALSVGMSPLGLAVGPEGPVFVESTTNELRRLEAGERGWRLMPLPCPQDESLQFQYQTAIRLAQFRRTRRVAFLDDGTLGVLDPFTHTLWTGEEAWALSDLEPGGCPGGYAQVTAVPGGLVLLDVWGDPLFVEAPARTDPLSTRIARARLAALVGDDRERDRLRGEIEQLGKDGGVPLKNLHDPDSSEGIMGLPDDLLKLVDGYAQDPSYAWRAAVALRGLGAPRP